MSLLIVAALTGALVFTGCDSNEDAPTGQIAEIAISPDTASLAVGEHVDFRVVALTAAGDTVRDADLALTWWSTDASVFTVDDGTATGQQAGTALCKVQASSDASIPTAGSRSRRFVGRDSAFVLVH